MFASSPQQFPVLIEVIALSGIALVLSAIVVAWAARKVARASAKVPSDPMYGTYFAKDPNQRPATN